jgi:hypothetical protein
VDRKVFRGVFGVVTWHACRKVQDHYDTTKKPYKDCTGIFTRVTGLPCAHLYDRRRDTGGFIPEDFHRHWFWDYNSTAVPYRDPSIIQPPNLPVAHTGRILSEFERVERTRAPPKCTACYRIGHTRASRNCPIRLHASIVEDSNRLEQGLLSQASAIPVTPNRPWRIRLEVPDSTRTTASQILTPIMHKGPKSTKSPNTGTQTPESARTTASQVFAPLIPFTIRESPNFLNTDPKFPNTSPKFLKTGVETLIQAPSHNETLGSPLRRFRPPPALEELGVAHRGTTPIILERYSNLAVLSEESQPEEPLKPLDPERIEMAILDYEQEKRSWLTAHPNIQAKDYRKIRGFRKIGNVGYYRRRLPSERRLPSGEIIERVTIWSEEEIFAFVHYQQKLEDRMVGEGLKGGFQVNKEGPRKMWERVQREVEKDAEQFTL